MSSAFTEMPKEVFKRELALMFGSLRFKEKVPEKLRDAYYIHYHVGQDEALAFSIYLNETANVRQFLEYWEKALEQQYFSQIDMPQIDSELEKMIRELNNTPEIIVSGLKFKKVALEKGEAQLRVLRDIKLRKMFLERYQNK